MAGRVRFFKVPAFYHLAWTLTGMGLMTVVAIAPGIIPYDRLSYLGMYLRFMAYDYAWLSKIIFVLGWGAHVYETTLARSQCRKLDLCAVDTTKWTIQTFLVGFPSLTLLYKYKGKDSKTS